MRILKNIALSMLLMATLVACDSNDDDSVADTFVGSWTVVSISDATGDQTQTFGAVVQSFGVDFAGSDTFELEVVFTDADPAMREPITLTGTYTVDENANSITLSGSFGGLPVTLPFNYEIVSEDRINLSTPSAAVNLLFGTAYEGTVQLTVART